MGRNLGVVGCGALGERIARRWRALEPDCRIDCETATTARHSAIRAALGAGLAGLEPRLASDPPPPPCPHLVIAVPPSIGHGHYLAAVKRALANWDAAAAPEGGGRLLLVSSTAVYPASAPEPCTEATPPAGTGGNAPALIAAEGQVLAAGGMVLRLAGLYDRDRGPHRVYLRSETIAQDPGGRINLIHYDDAAALAVLALRHGLAGAVYLGCDDGAYTRADLAAMAYAARGAILPAESAALARHCRFTGVAGDPGRRLDNRRTRAALGWRPVYRDFGAWLQTLPVIP